jgi:heptosyltransferase-2
MGDVLRSTFMLRGLKKKYKNCHITWLVSKNNAQVLLHNPLINEIATADNAMPLLCGRYFDVLINLDLSPESLALTRAAFKGEVLGYSLDDKRNIVCSNDWASKWLEMSAYDDIKKANKKTYQFGMAHIVETADDKGEIIVPLTQEAKRKALAFLKSKNINPNQEIIGINPGAGKRWPMKKWTIDGYIKVIKQLSKENKTILLLGGREDIDDINMILNAGIKNVFFTGVFDEVGDFFAMLNLCDIIICSDTMAMHAGLGLKKKVIAVFGPTSSSEIEMYGRGVKIFSGLDCLCCYKQNCDKQDNCMTEIKPSKILKAIRALRG